MEKEKSRVLIVDDMQINRVVLASLLATQGILSDQVESGAECLELCAQNEYDLILLDHRMPDMDGAETLMRLKELFASQKREIPVICHTTEEGRDNINLYKAAGFADVLIKPVDPGEFFQVLMTYLSDDRAFPDEEIYLPVSDIPEEEFEIDQREEIEKLPLWIKLVPQLDLSAGITNCGSADDYLDALYIFYSSIDEKAEELEHFLYYEDWTMYALRIHSLKSMARLVGAKKLADKAAILETAARSENYPLVRRDTPDFIDSYREFDLLLDELSEKEAVDVEEPADASPEPESVSNYYGNNILYIQSGRGIVKKGIENNLTESGFNVTSIPDEPDLIIANRNTADIIIYNPSMSDNSAIGITMNLLGELCQDNAKILCLTGDVGSIDSAMGSYGSHRVSKTYLRPVDMDRLIRDMKYFAYLEEEYHRKKTLFITDDDPGYLSVIDHWLSPEYNVLCFTDADSVMNGFSTVTPDLILLDLEMPETNGCDIMKMIRREHPDLMTPIIFLTGNNDKDMVMKVLESKPDGYILKTTQKEALQDLIRRFFAEYMFKQTQNT